MKFSSDPELEARVGRVCLVYARVEQEVGHVVMAAHGGWGDISTDYLAYSANSGLLLKWLNAVARAYPEAKADADRLSQELRGLKVLRDEWAHSADVVDLFLVLLEEGRATLSNDEVPPGQLLNARKMKHRAAPTQADVDGYVAQASDVGDLATALAGQLAVLVDEGGSRAVQDPRTKTQNDDQGESR